MSDQQTTYQPMLDMVAKIPLPAVLVAIDGTIVGVNAPCAELLGATVSDLCGTHVLAHIHPDDHDMAVAGMMRYRNEGIASSVTARVRLVTADGSAQHVNLRAGGRTRLDEPVLLIGEPTDEEASWAEAQLFTHLEALTRTAIDVTAARPAATPLDMLVEHLGEAMRVDEVAVVRASRDEGVVTIRARWQRRPSSEAPEPMVLGTWPRLLDLVNDVGLISIEDVSSLDAAHRPSGLETNHVGALVARPLAPASGHELHLVVALVHHHARRWSTADVALLRAMSSLAEQVIERTDRQPLFSAVFDQSPMGMAVTTPAMRSLAVNQAMCEVFGATADQLIARPLLDHVAPDDRDRLIELYLPLARGTVDQVSCEVRLARLDGELRWALLSSAVVRDLHTGEARHVVHHVLDRHEQRQVEDDLAWQAMHDSLTGLANRRLLIEHLDHALARAGAGRVALVFCDLDRFKVVNDSLGHAAGDALLIEVARRVQQIAGADAVVARLGGDELVALVEGLTSAEAAVALGDALRAALAAPVWVDGQALAVTASIGIAFARPGDRAADVLRHADAAMYEAKARGRDRVEVFDDQLRESVRSRLDLEQALTRAARNGELVVHYQPVVDLRTNRIVGAEALARWDHPDRGLLLPKEFISLAEDMGVVVPIGFSVLETTLRQLAAWQTKGLDTFVVRVNLSARQITQARAVEEIASAISASGVQADRLCLEVTESMVLADLGAAAERLRALKALGVTIALDDFGTGWSSLAVLRRLPIDTVKIDRSFVAGLPEDREGFAIVAAVTRLARSLGVGVVAEGVESPRQVDALLDIGVTEAQGRWLGIPVDAEMFSTLLAADLTRHGAP